jgi:surface polysaccharide O-acyltransferase-like enzyme
VVLGYVLIIAGIYIVMGILSSQEKLMKTKQLILPRVAYGPIASKIIKEFMNYHNIPDYTLLPNLYDKSHELLAKILNIMLLTMSEYNREALLKDAEAYLNDLPPNLR